MFRSLAVVSAVLALAGEGSAQCSTYSAQRGVYVQRQVASYGYAPTYAAPGYQTYQTVVPVATAVYVIPGTPTTALNLYQPVYVPQLAIAAAVPAVQQAAPTLPAPPAGYSYQLVPTPAQQAPAVPPAK